MCVYIRYMYICKMYVCVYIHYMCIETASVTYTGLQLLIAPASPRVLEL